jgi:thymidylate synthase
MGRACGPRLFGAGALNQFENVARLLADRPTTRKAVIQLFDGADLAGTYKDVPCTCTLQFMVRDGRLDLVASMRSNDAFFGLPHDVFAFTMLQEIMAETVGCELGEYSHFAASLHLYEENAGDAQDFIDEGFQGTVGAAMPAMPRGAPQPSIAAFLRAEAAIRSGRTPGPEVESLHSYWQDLVRLLRVFRHSKDGDLSSVSRIKGEMIDRVYKESITAREKRGRTARPQGPAATPTPPADQ